VSSGDPDTPKRQRLLVTEEAPGENEIFRFKHRAVTLRLEDASEANLRELDYQLHSIEQDDIPLLLRLGSDLVAIQTRLDELERPSAAT
jgi:hypothetical protein